MAGQIKGVPSNPTRADSGGTTAPGAPGAAAGQGGAPRMAAGAPALPDPQAIIAAVEVLLAAGVLDEVRRLANRYGPDLIRSGHAARVEAWDAALARLDARPGPQALLLHAATLAERDVVQAGAAYHDAHDAAVAAGEPAIALQAACGLLHNIFIVWGDFRLLPEVLPAAEAAFGEAAAHPDATIEIECLTGLLAGWLLARPDHPRLAALAERVFALALGEGAHPAARLDAGAVLLAYCQLWALPDRGLAMIARLDTLRGHAAVTAGRYLSWRFQASLFCCQVPNADPQMARTLLADYAADLARVAPSPAGGDPAHPAPAPASSRDSLLYYQHGRLAFEVAGLLGDFPALERAVQQMQRWLNPALPLHVITVAHREASAALLQRQYQRALQAARQAVARAEQAGVPTLLLSVYRGAAAMAAMMCGEYDTARAVTRRLLSDGTAQHRDQYLRVDKAIAVVEAFQQGGDPVPAVADYMDNLARSGDLRCFSFSADMGARTMACALQHGIHPDLARRVIAFMRFPPPADLSEHWPWVLKLQLLGPPAVYVGQSPLGGKGKAQQRPLDLLTAIALHGGGDAGAAGGADAEALMLQLWPDADAKPAFDVTLMRLRKLLQHEGLVTLTDGKLRLDRQRVWCDVWAFEARLDTLLQAGAAHSSAAMTDLVALYRGPLLGDEKAPLWAVSARERLRNKFLQAAATFGAAAEGDRQWPAALAIYERGLAQDQLAEDLYRGLMRCHLALGEHANALRAYRRCRELLSIVLGVRPSAETEALHAAIKA